MIDQIIAYNRPPENEIDFKIKIPKNVLNGNLPMLYENYELNGLTIYEYKL